jgi:hypothetical protein
MTLGSPTNTANSYISNLYVTTYTGALKESKKEANKMSNLEDEADYEVLDWEITEAMLHASLMCAFWKQHASPWTETSSKVAHSIRYWDARLAQKG